MKRIFSIFIFQVSIFLFFTSCYSFFQDKIAKDSESPGTDLADLIIEETVITMLPAPKTIEVSQALSPKEVFVTWAAVSGAVYYRLERAVVTTKNSVTGKFDVPEDGDFEVLNKYVYGNVYTDSIFSSLDTPSYNAPEYSYGYFYRVSAINERNKYDPSEYTESSKAGTLFAPVTTISATKGESETAIEVKWEKVKNASRYEIYRSTNSKGEGASLLDTIPASQNWYKNEVEATEQGEEFYYIIKALNSKYSTVLSPVALGYSLVGGAPGQVKNVVIKNGRGDTLAKDGITVQWDAVTASGEVKYSIYRTSSIDSSSILLKDALTETTYTDNANLTQNVYYYYQVLAYVYDEEEQKKLKGPISSSSVSDKTPAEGYILSPPSSLSVVNSEKSGYCDLTFPAALGSSECPSDSRLSTAYNTYKYKIYINSTQSGEYSLLDTVDIANHSAISGYYTITVPAAKFYKISTYRDDIPLESETGMVAAPAPYAATNLVATKHAFIDKITVSGGQNDNGVYPVKITWDAPEGGADGGYYLYRSTKQNSGFRKVEDSAITQTEYIDRYDAAKPGTIYYYRVLSLNSLNQGANYSNVDSGYGALTHDQYMREYNKTIKQSHRKFKLMHKPSTSALGSESIRGDVSGSASYEAKMDGLGARIIMYYDNYVDFNIGNDSEFGPYFKCTGNTNTSANMNANGSMDGTVTCTGMYPGSVGYDKIEIKGGGAGGGYYVIKPEGFSAGNVSWTVGEE